jgi:Cd2+/Zn2+-exporting ATPase
LASSKRAVNIKLGIRDLDCMDCARALERVAGSLEGVEEARVSFAFSSLDLRLRDETYRKPVIRQLRHRGYEVYPAEGGIPSPRGALKGAISRRRIVLTSICGACLAGALIVWVSGFGMVPTRALLAAAIVAGLPPTLLRALAALRSRSVDMDVLMSIAIVAAAIIGQWDEAAVVAFLFSVAIMLESLAMARTRSAIESLMELAPDTATVIRDGVPTEVDAGTIGPGEKITVRPGERVPLEGYVFSGVTSVDESAITGEPMPVGKQGGDPVFAGTLNGEGLIQVIVTKPKEESTLAKIIHLIEHVEESRAPVERFVDRFARIYTPSVIGAALLVAVLPHLAGIGGSWVYRSIVILIIACPCALVISTPVAVVSGLTAAARRGILIKGGAFLEQTANIRAIALDKTGTVTLGRPSVAAVTAHGSVSEDDLVRLASAIESGSTHPLAGAVMAEARRRRLHWPTPRNVTTIPGRGIRGEVEGKTYLVAKPEFASGEADPDALPESGSAGRTALVVSSGTEILGTIEFTDRVRPEVARTVAELKQMGILRTAIVTGDRDKVARAVADEAGVDEYHADLLPEGKVAVIDRLKREFDTVAMVGDGVNDAPALAAAHVGVAMGAAGSDTAIDTANVALMSDDIERLVPLLRISKSVKRVTIENIGFAISLKALFLVLASLGSATMWMAVFADMGASLIVISNALRVLKEGDAKSAAP